LEGAAQFAHHFQVFWELVCNGGQFDGFSGDGDTSSSEEKEENPMAEEEDFQRHFRERWEVSFAS